MNADVRWREEEERRVQPCYGSVTRSQPREASVEAWPDAETGTSGLRLDARRPR